MADLEISTDRFDAALVGYVADLNLNAGKVVRVQARLLIKQWLRFVPPVSLAQGRAAVARDVRKVFNVVEDTKWDPFWDAQGRLQIFPRGKRAKAARGKPRPSFDGYLSPAQMASHHHGRLNRRGRVARGNQTRLIGLDRGAVAFAGVVRKRDFIRYLREVQKHVGRAKSSLLRAYAAVGGTLPTWVTRHGGKGGTVVDQMLHKTHPHLIIHSQSEGLAAVEPRSIQQAITTRARAMENDIRRIMAGGKSRYFS